MGGRELRVQLFSGNGNDINYQFRSFLSGTEGESHELNEVTLPRSAARLIYDRLFDTTTSRQDLLTASTRIGSALLPPESLDLFQSAWTDRNGEPLRIRIVCPATLADIPWEYARLRDPLPGEATNYLSLCHGVTIVRHEPARHRPTVVGVGPPLKILIVDATDARPGVSLQGHSEELREMAERDGAAVTLVREATERRTVDALRDFRPHVVLFLGHAEAHVLHLHGGSMPAGVLASECKASAVQVAVLAGCETSRRENHGLLDELLRAPIPAVVGWPRRVDDNTASTFTRHFLQSVARGDPIDEAVSVGRRAASHAQGWDDWALVTTYLRTADARLLRNTGLPMPVGLASRPDLLRELAAALEVLPHELRPPAPELDPLVEHFIALARLAIGGSGFGRRLSGDSGRTFHVDRQRTRAAEADPAKHLSKLRESLSDAESHGLDSQSAAAVRAALRFAQSALDSTPAG